MRALEGRALTSCGVPCETHVGRRHPYRAVQPHAHSGEAGARCTHRVDAGTQWAQARLRQFRPAIGDGVC
jgi:hypothetical protein